eukprot:TRINITY_DN833_c0_g1_i3.p1 TRINITY_DN833_c0_g1~~TRINITY_DN833_c0_g1_i3.p1  ORF type:complete len:785 (+),score=133.66 TRINITY_DN833_c0_g1_i3:534-2888(+)
MEEFTSRKKLETSKERKSEDKKVIDLSADIDVLEIGSESEDNSWTKVEGKSRLLKKKRKTEKKPAKEAVGVAPIINKPTAKKSILIKSSVASPSRSYAVAATQPITRFFPTVSPIHSPPEVTPDTSRSPSPELITPETSDLATTPVSKKRTVSERSPVDPAISKTTPEVSPVRKKPLLIGPDGRFMMTSPTNSPQTDTSKMGHKYDSRKNALSDRLLSKNERENIRRERKLFKQQQKKKRLEDEEMRKKRKQENAERVGSSANTPTVTLRPTKQKRIPQQEHGDSSDDDEGKEGPVDEDYTPENEKDEEATRHAIRAELQLNVQNSVGTRELIESILKLGEHMEMEDEDLVSVIGLIDAYNCKQGLRGKSKKWCNSELDYVVKFISKTMKRRMSRYSKERKEAYLQNKRNSSAYFEMVNAEITTIGQAVRIAEHVLGREFKDEDWLDFRLARCIIAFWDGVRDKVEGPADPKTCENKFSILSRFMTNIAMQLNTSDDTDIRLQALKAAQIGGMYSDKRNECRDLLKGSTSRNTVWQQMEADEKVLKTHQLRKILRASFRFMKRVVTWKVVGIKISPKSCFAVTGIVQVILQTTWGGQRLQIIREMGINDLVFHAEEGIHVLLLSEEKVVRVDGSQLPVSDWIAELLQWYVNEIRPLLLKAGLQEPESFWINGAGGPASGPFLSNVMAEWINTVITTLNIKHLAFRRYHITEFFQGNIGVPGLSLFDTLLNFCYFVNTSPGIGRLFYNQSTSVQKNTKLTTALERHNITPASFVIGINQTNHFTN